MLEFLEKVSVRSDINLTDSRFQVQLVIRPQTEQLHDYRGYAGKIISGIYRKGNKVTVLPQQINSTISKLETGGLEVDEVFAPQPAIIHLVDDIDISRGDTIVKSDNLPLINNELEVLLCWMDEKPLQPGNKYLLQHNSRLVKSSIKKIEYKLDVNSLQKQSAEGGVKLNEVVKGIIKTASPLVSDSYPTHNPNGSAVLIDETSNNTVAAVLPFASSLRGLKLSAIATSLLMALPAWAVDPFMLKDIRVEGLQRVEPGTVFASLPFRIGDQYTDDKGSSAIRSLFGWGLFSDVRLQINGDVLVVIVEERPSVADGSFTGIKEFDAEVLKKALREVGLAEGRPFDKALADRAEQELKRQYINRSLYGAEVVTTVTPSERNQVRLTFNITEGRAARIKDIDIVGNHAFSDGRLKDLFDLDTGGWLSWYTKSDQYSRAKLNADLEALRSFYLARGYLDFKSIPRRWPWRRTRSRSPSPSTSPKANASWCVRAGLEPAGSARAAVCS